MTDSLYLLSLLFIWPLVAVVAHIGFGSVCERIRMVIQSGCIVIWFTLVVMLFMRQPDSVAMMMGGWQAPFGIALYIDQLSTLMLLVFAIVVVCINWYSYQDAALAHTHKAFYAGFWLLLLGVSGALFTADLFNLYVWFELILVSAFVLLASSQKPKASMMLHYAILNIMGTLLMLLAIALLYGVFGTLNIADIAVQLAKPHPSWVLAILCLFIFALGLKGGVFPLYFWLPKAYPKPSHTATMLLSSLITKVVMVVLLRLVWLWPDLHHPFMMYSLIGVALATMFFGVLGAANQFRFKEILSFHIISQLGYILLVIFIPLPIAIIAAVYFLIHNIFVKTSLFMVAGIVEQKTGTGDLKKLGAFLKQHRLLAIGFFLAAMSLAGFPPLSGFWGKLFVIQSALEDHLYWSAGIAVLVSLLTLYSMIKIWRYVFCEPAELVSKTVNAQPLRFGICLLAAVLPLIVLPILMGLMLDSVMHMLQPIANQLQHAQSYTQFILGGQR